jgi:hypothetical protein
MHTVQLLLRHTVPQLNPLTGCIPAGFEWLIRTAGVGGIDFSTFQGDFDLQNRGLGENNFQTVASAVAQRYPHVRFVIRAFGTGAEKAAFLIDRVAISQPTLVSLTLQPQGGWHIMPVLGWDGQSFDLLFAFELNSQARLLRITREELIARHDEWPGGNDVAYLKTLVAGGV